MGFFSSAISILQTLVSAIGAGLGVWGVINLLEGYGNDNPGAKSQGIKQPCSPAFRLVRLNRREQGSRAKERRIDPCSMRYLKRSKYGCGLF